MLARLDPLVATPTHLSAEQLDELVAFVGDGLLDPRAKPANLRRLVPKRVPSGRPTLAFQFMR
jgi:cytochrome c peroxidase